jgi:hypothetical protein
MPVDPEHFMTDRDIFANLKNENTVVYAIVLQHIKVPHPVCSSLSEVRARGAVLGG